MKFRRLQCRTNQLITPAPSQMPHHNTHSSPTCKKKANYSIKRPPNILQRWHNSIQLEYLAYRRQEMSLGLYKNGKSYYFQPNHSSCQGRPTIHTTSSNSLFPRLPDTKLSGEKARQSV